MKRIVCLLLLLVLVFALSGCSFDASPIFDRSTMIPAYENLRNVKYESPKPITTSNPTPKTTPYSETSDPVKQTFTPESFKTPVPYADQVTITYDLGYEEYQSKKELGIAFYTEFYYYLKNNKVHELNKLGIENAQQFVQYMFTPEYDVNALPKYGMNHTGNNFGHYYIIAHRGYSIKEQDKSSFIGYCRENNLFVDLINHLELFYYYWRTDEGHTNKNDSSFFYLAWPAMVDTSKFFVASSSNVESYYGWPNSPYISYYLDVIPGIRTACVTFESAQSVVLPSNISRSGFVFDGWYDENGGKIESVTKSMTVYAHWTEV